MRALAIDLGSSNARLIFSENGVKRCVARFGCAPKLLDGGYRWDVNELFSSVVSAIDGVIDEGGLDSIGICSWGVDYGWISPSGKLLDLPFCYRDERNTRAFNAFFETHDKMSEFMKTGVYPLAINTVYQLLADKAAGRGTGAKLLMIADLLAYRLTGSMRVERTNASTTELLSVDGKEWNFARIRELGLDEEAFSPLISAGESYGSYRGVPVVAVCTHDTASAVLAMDVNDEESLFVSGGSWTLAGTVLEKPFITDRAFGVGFTNERGYEDCVTFLSNANGLFPVQRLVSELNLSYEEIDKNVESARSLGKLDLDALNSPSDMLSQLVYQLGCLFATPIDLVRTIYDAIANGIKIQLTRAALLTKMTARRVVLTGGITKVPYLVKKIHEVVGLPVEVACEEGAVEGNLRVQEKYLRERA